LINHNAGDVRSRTVPSPLLALASPTNTATEIALAGKEVEISVWDVERTFSTETTMKDADGKRKKDTLESGEIWRARNVGFMFWLSPENQ